MVKNTIIFLIVFWTCQLFYVYGYTYNKNRYIIYQGNIYLMPADRPRIVSNAVYGEPGSRTLSLRACANTSVSK